MVCVGALAMDMARTRRSCTLVPPRTRHDIFEEVCGARLTYNYMTIGGVSYDAPPGFIEKCDDFADYLWPRMVEFNELITSNTIFIERLCNVGICPRDKAINWGLRWPESARIGCQIRYSQRRAVFDLRQIEIRRARRRRGDPHGSNPRGTLGDSYDRYVVRVKEVFESIKIIKQICTMMRENEKLPAIIRPSLQAKLPDACASSAAKRTSAAKIRAAKPAITSSATERKTAPHENPHRFVHALGCFEEVDARIADRRRDRGDWELRYRVAGGGSLTCEH